MIADTVVFLPRPTLALSSWVLSCSPGCTALSRLDFPAPDGPVTTETRPVRAAANSATPTPVRMLVEIDVVPGPLKPIDQRAARVEVHLVEHHGGGDLVGFGDDEQTIDELGNGGRMARGGHDEDLIDIRGHGPGAASFGNPALEQARAGLQTHDAVQLAGRLRFEANPVAYHQPLRLPLHLAPEHRPELPLGGRDPVDRSIALEDRAEEAAYHSAGARAIASSSAALTS